MRVLVAERYRLNEPVGRGAMGEVWRATDQTLGRPVAVKLLRADDAGAEASEQFGMEAQTAARLNHPHVVSMYDFGCHDGQFYLVMELVDGWSLAQELAAHGPLDPQEAASIGTQMAAGLSAAHLQGVIHRDIKPGNIMLTADRIVKITDFGIARFTDDASHTLAATGKILGTGAYLAPERAVGRPAIPASDVYALGCVLYELLTGRPPFLGENTPAVVLQQVSAAPIPPDQLRPEIPGALSDHLLLLLAKDPAQRPTAEQAAGWLAGVEGHLDQAPPADTVSPADWPVPPASAHPPLSTRSRRAAGRPSRAVIGIAGAVAVAVAAVIGAAAISGDDDPSAPGNTAPSTSAPPSEPPLSDAPSAMPSSELSSSASDDDEDEEDEPGKQRRKGRGKRGND